MTAPRKARVELPRLHEAQRRILQEAKRFNVLNCGRRFGKDVVSIDCLTDTVLHGFPVAWFAPTYKNLTEVWRVLDATLEPVIRRRSEQEHRLDLWTGGVVDMWSLDQPGTARGRAYKRVIVNEAAQVANLQEAWEAVIRPTLTDYQGDAWFPSTPQGFNYFKALYDRGQDALQTEWRSWTFPTSANPFISPAEIETARIDLPEKTFAQEYLAVFVSDEAGVFRRVLDAATATAQTGRVEQHAYCIGVDWGQVNDFSVFSVVDLTTKEQVYQDRSNRVEYLLQEARLQALCQRFSPVMLIAEANAMGTPIIERLRRQGLPVYPWTATNATKAAVVQGLALAFEQASIKVLPDAVLLGELQAYQAERLPSGLIRYTAPSGMHDDTVIALGLAWMGTGARPAARAYTSDFRVEAA